MTVKKLARMVGVSRATFYRHHQGVGRIVPDYHYYIIHKYSRAVRRLSVGNARPEQVVQRLLFFIVQNKKIFLVLMRGRDTEIFAEMVMKLEPFFSKMLRLPKNSGEMYVVYAGGVSGLLIEWGEDGFPEGKIEELKGKIMYLTETMRTSLAPLLK